MNARVLVVIPARYGSSRFPGKPLADLCGKPLVVRTLERAAGMRSASEVLAATDDPRIAAAVTSAGFACEMTGDHPTGTDRIGEVLDRYPADIVVNLQADEPLLEAEIADRLVLALQEDQQASVATCAHPFGPDDDWAAPHTVKVLVDRTGRALYFSRAPVPGVFPGSTPGSAPRDAALRHVGIYAWRAPALRRYLAWPRGCLEQIEGLEQLRALENGLVIKVVTVAAQAVGVDTPADLERVRAIWQRNAAGGRAAGDAGRNG
ncbi:MAG: 3-deoxy-manno-octulosonate cytidylyltransferase [Candidatus Krumholzibacteria bacterium]|nr:3-deoxy-manno-octulosonate cytidylyltransferase [Candidatus Krumholzibacteria bacterium]